jgi:uncharacterized membrane protein YccC
MQRYLTARSNLLAKAKKAIEDYRKNRTNETVKAEKHEIVKQTAKRKAEDEMTVEECIKEMEEIAELRRLLRLLKNRKPAQIRIPKHQPPIAVSTYLSQLPPFRRKNPAHLRPRHRMPHPHHIHP